MKEKAILATLVLAIVGSATYAAIAMPVDEAPPLPQAPVVSIATPVAVPKLTPTASAKAGTTLVLTSQLSHPFVLAGDGDAPTYLQVDVDAIEFNGQTSAPLDVAIVIDRSGSMSGPKLNDAKQAARQFVARLRAGDRVAVISYNHVARVDSPFLSLADARNVGEVDARIARLSSGGGTNIHSALQLARDTFLASRDDSRVRRLILLSDGKAGMKEECAQLAGTMRSDGISTTAMGLGTDYDELMLAGIADGGGGNYYFIADARNLEPTFDKEFSSLQKAVAKNTVVTLDLADGVEMKAIHGFKHIQAGSHFEVPLEVFWSKRNASVLAELQVDRAKTGEFDAVTVGLRYNDLLTGVTGGPFASCSSRLTMATTASVAEVEENLNGEVLVRYEKIANALAYDRAMVEYESGNAEAAQTILQKRGKDLRDRSAYLSRAGNFNGRDKGALLGGLSEDSDKSVADASALRALPASSGEGRAFIKGNRASSRKSKLVF